jgi:hypothetical protein
VTGRQGARGGEQQVEEAGALGLVAAESVEFLELVPH